MKGVKRIMLCLLAGLACFQMAGCGGSKEPASGRLSPSIGEAGGADWLAEPLTFPQYKKIYTGTAYENTLYCQVEKQGSGLQNHALISLDLAKQDAVPAVLPYQFAAGEYIMSLTTDTEGFLHFISYRYENEQAGAAVWKKLSPDGKEMFSCPLEEYFASFLIPLPYGMAVDGKGQGWFYLENRLMGIGSDGVPVFQMDMPGTVLRLGNTPEGEIYVAWQGSGGMELTRVGADGDGLGVGQEISLIGSRVSGMDGGADGNLLLASDRGIFGYDLAKNELREKCNWTNLNILPGNYNDFAALADGRMMWIDQDSQTDGEAEMLLLREAKEGEEAAAAKTVLTLGVTSSYLNSPPYVSNGQAIKEAVVDFNQENGQYRIEIIEYADDVEGLGGERLNMDILTGNCPDILILPDRFNLRSYVGMGLLEDLYPYFNQDSRFRMEDFAENIIKTAEIDRKLYAFPYEYRIGTMFAKTSVIGDFNQWNLNDMIAFADSQMPEKEVFEYLTKSSVLELCLYANWEQLVDWDGSGKGFDRELLTRALEFSNRFMEEGEYVHDNDVGARIAADQILLLDDFGLRSVEDTTVHGVLMGGPVSYMGYPSEQGSGNIVNGVRSFAISSQCPDKAAAWSMVSGLLTAEVQESSLITELPVRHSALEKRFEAGKDKPGQWIWGSTVHTTTGITEEGAQALREIIASVEKMVFWDDQIRNIVHEEAAPYFSGGKTVTDTVDVIANRIGIYIAEMN